VLLLHNANDALHTAFALNHIAIEFTFVATAQYQNAIE
jgi:hypothetical protein